MTGQLRIQQTSTPGGAGEGTFSPGIANRQGMQVVQDFYTYAMLLGLGFQVRAGTITTPIVGDVVITDTAAEMAMAPALGTTIIPVSANISFRLAAATLFESAAKSVGAATMSAGTSFVPLPLKIGGAAAVSPAMVGTAGGVTVAAEVVTTTRRHFSWSQPIAAGAWPTTYDWNPRTPPVLQGPACFYLQIAAATTGPSYYAHFDVIEVATAMIL